jgi:hypothetical protein
MRRILPAAIVVLLLAGTQVRAQAANKDHVDRMMAAAPLKPIVAPKKARKLLIFTLAKGFKHSTIPLAAESIKHLGEKTKAWTSVISEDPQVFKPQSLAAFDAVCFDQCTGDPFTEKDLQASLIEFVKSGRGFIGIHAATDCFYGWKEYGEMIGGYFDGHPFSRISVKLDDPRSPINLPFEGKGFEITDEIYTFRDPYSRDKLRILLSLDWEGSKTPGGGKRQDNDYALSWIRDFGKGRVFYCAFGHQEPVWWNPKILTHVLAGTQYAFGDLKADATPSTAMKGKLVPVPGPKLN